MKKGELFPTSITNIMILLILYDFPKHGYGLMKELEERLGKRPSHGTVYPFLQELSKKGYVSARRLEGRGKTVYALTGKGRRLVERLMERLDTLLSVALEKKVRACANCGCQIYSGGIEKKIGGRTLLFCCAHCASNFKP